MKTLKLILYKYGWHALCILLEVVAVILIFTFLANKATILWVFAFIISFITFIAAVNHNSSPEFKIPWISIILIFQPFGSLIYILFARRKMRKSEINHLKLLEDDFQEVLKNKRYDKDLIETIDQGKIRHLLHDDYLSNVYNNTISKYYSLGDDMFPDMLNDLKKAKKFIFLEYFIIADGRMWNDILEILANKVNSGVEVRMLYDDIGCMTTLPRDYDKTLRLLGIKCYKFNKFSADASCIHNNRDHRKMLIIDGKIGYTGGINLADEYINEKERFGHWKDGGIRLEGEAVNGLSHLFLLNYDINNKVVSKYKNYESNYKVEGDGLYIPFGSGPPPLYQEPVGENIFLDIINQAERYIYITTPYLIIDYNLCKAIKCAAVRGVDVRIITPHIPDKKLIHLITRSFYNELMENGVKIYEYKPGFIHTKDLISDDKIGVVGTINFDYRSFIHHYEDAIFMYKTSTIEDMKKDFTSTQRISKEMSKIKLSFPHRLILNLVRLFITMF